MKYVCIDCRHEKPGNPHFCTKYGIPIWTKRVYCVSKEPKGSENIDAGEPEQVRREEDGN